MQFTYIDNNFLDFANLFDNDKYGDIVFFEIANIINISNFSNAIFRYIQLVIMINKRKRPQYIPRKAILNLFINIPFATKV